jgi:hypothetical protein
MKKNRKDLNLSNKGKKSHRKKGNNDFKGTSKKIKD